MKKTSGEKVLKKTTNNKKTMAVADNKASAKLDKETDKFCMQDLKRLLIKKAQGFYFSEEQTEFESSSSKTKPANKNSLQNLGSEILTCEKKDIQCTKKQKDLQPQADEKNQELKNTCKEQNFLGGLNEDSPALVVVKKKVSTHFVPPDSLAIKMLFEIFGKEIAGEDAQSDIEKLSNDELEKEIARIDEILKKEVF